MSAITTHILDIAAGQPARGVAVSLSRQGEDGGWIQLAEGHTDEDGRVGTLLPEGELPTVGVYRIRFEVGAYFASGGGDGFYPFADVVFEIRDPDEHYHVPLLLSPYGYSTYRGS